MADDIGSHADGLHADTNGEGSQADSTEIQAVLRILAETQQMMLKNRQGFGQKARVLANVRIPNFDGSETTTVRQYREWRKTSSSA